MFCKTLICFDLENIGWVSITFTHFSEWPGDLTGPDTSQDPVRKHGKIVFVAQQSIFWEIGPQVDNIFRFIRVAHMTVQISNHQNGLVT